MQARMENPARLMPETVGAVNTLYKAARSSGVPASTLELVHLRASQINGGASAWTRAPAARRRKG